MSTYAPAPPGEVLLGQVATDLLPGSEAALLDALRAVGEPSRLRIVVALRAGERTVSELTRILGQSQPRVSRHLKILGDAGLISRFAEGSWVFCRLREHPLISAVLDWIPETSPEFAEDRRRLEELLTERSRASEEYFHRHAHEWDSLRSLYVSESRVEQAIVELAGTRRVGTLLDIGTGTGRMLQLLAPLARYAIGIDRSVAMLAAARPAFDHPTFGHVHLRHGDMYRLPIGAESIECAIVHQVLHFADDAERVLREAARVVRPGGRVLLVDFAPHTLEFLRTEHAHRRLGFTTEEVTAWGHRAGLTVREVTRLPGTPLTVVLWEATKGPTPAAS
ncbi:MAG: metalloregulator ArsR/SmtB family transcription factor [Gemmatimonadaceae bacterium]|jgi:ArsR family transcriptional regulator|nr:metalloregulator ArsR/SmtB family transcription factor [Gemmatimonadaceae bacterium]